MQPCATSSGRRVSGRWSKRESSVRWIWLQPPHRRSFVRAFNHKIVPTLLTILSTALGLIPFLTDGPDEVFWYAFALGTIGGLAFSLVALVFFLPAWIKSD